MTDKIPLLRPYFDDEELHEIKKVDIDEITPQAVSTMPEGLEKRLTEWGNGEEEDAGKA